MIMTLIRSKKSWLTFVPAVAVIQRGQTIFIFIKFKGYVDGLFLNIIKF